MDRLKKTNSIHEALNDAYWNIQMPEIRIAQPEDTKTIQGIYQAVVGPHADIEQVLWERLIQQRGMVVAQVEGRIVGFGCIDVHAPEQVKWLYLLQQHRGTGLGSEILERLENIGWEAGLDSLRVHSATGAAEFYRRQGYRPVEAAPLMGHDHEGIEMMKDRPIHLTPK